MYEELLGLDLGDAAAGHPVADDGSQRHTTAPEIGDQPDRQRNSLRRAQQVCQIPVVGSPIRCRLGQDGRQGSFVERLQLVHRRVGHGGREVAKLAGVGLVVGREPAGEDPRHTRAAFLHEPPQPRSSALRDLVRVEE
ncbi:MAG: hypothetical protein LC808_03310 [Actinobacteria bacterium]|nr:hypothetical protein [Actinomycetota bacterium]